ncbi:hypothetical protein D9M68_780930 [compost metagenome]
MLSLDFTVGLGQLFTCLDVVLIAQVDGLLLQLVGLPLQAQHLDVAGSAHGCQALSHPKLLAHQGQSLVDSREALLQPFSTRFVQRRFVTHQSYVVSDFRWKAQFIVLHLRAQARSSGQCRANARGALAH